MSVYSFLNISATMVGPGLSANLAAGAAIAEEGIDIEAVEDKNVMTVGADGKVQHSLIASDASTMTIRTLKTSPLNQLLMIAYDLQSSSSALWGQNVLTLNDSGRGDLITGTQIAFKKVPKLTYAKEAGMNEWIFDVGFTSRILGASQ